MDRSGDPVLTAWAAEVAAHALAQFPDFADEAANQAVAAAKQWAGGDADALEACRDAAYEAHLSARSLTEAGYHALATCVRAASNAAASADDPALAEAAADYALEALTMNSAPCEQQYNAEAERRWQWEQLPEPHRAQLFETEPPEPGPAACAI
ncbi:MAG: hypothetical protein LWW77_11640 [Propionibacteriales bacterium]|nr:hypothetical protein [Propionibacteriales bacterium]